jgi:hypothetical protein
MKIKFNKTTVNKLLFLFLLLTIATTFESCESCNSNEENPPTIKRFSLSIIAPKESKNGYVEITPLMLGDSMDNTVFLPDENSNLSLVDCSNLPLLKISFFVSDEDLYTPTQLTAGSYDWGTISPRVEKNINSNVIENIKKLPIIGGCADSTILEKMKVLMTPLNDARLYTFCSESSFDSLHYTDTTYKHHFTNIDSLKAVIKRDLKNNYNNIVVIFNPPIKKATITSTPVLVTNKEPSSIISTSIKLKKEEKAEKKQVETVNIPLSQKAEEYINWKQPIKINTDNKSYFEWTDFGSNVFYDYKIEDYDDKKMVDSGTVTENRLNVPSSNIIKNRQYKLTIMAKYKNKNKSEVYVFSVEPNGSISQECKK